MQPSAALELFFDVKNFRKGKIHVHKLCHLPIITLPSANLHFFPRFVFLAASILDLLPLFPGALHGCFGAIAIMLTRARRQTSISRTILNPPVPTHSLASLRRRPLTQLQRTVGAPACRAIHIPNGSSGPAASGRTASLPIRSLSTAADSAPISQTYDLPIFDILSRPAQSAVPLSRLQWQPPSALVHPNPDIIPPWDRHAANVEELVQNMHACLSIGKLDRAEEILRRMADMSKATTAAIVEANTLYIRCLVDSLTMAHQHVSLRRVQAWFELGMKQLGLLPNPDTFALLCKAAFTVSNVPARDRTLRRYLYMSESMGMLEQTLSSGELSSEHWNVLCRLRKDIFDDVPQEDQPAAEAPNNAVAESGPTINPTLQQGMGLTSLMEGLKSLHARDEAPTSAGWEAKREWQLQLEDELVAAEVARWEAEHAELLKMGVDPILSGSLEATLWGWLTALEASMEKYLKEIGQDGKEKNWIASYGPVLEQLTPRRLAATTIMGTLRMFMVRLSKDSAYELPIVKVLNHIGGNLEMEVFADKYSDVKAERLRKFKTAHRHKVLRRAVKFRKADKAAKKDDVKASADTFREWPMKIKTKIAAVLVSKLIEVAKIGTPSGNQDSPEDVDLRPAFRHETKWIRGKPRGVLELEPVLRERLLKKPISIYEGGNQLPMVCEPDPWQEYRGAYLRTPAQLMRTKDNYGLQQAYLKAAIARGDVEQIFRALNVLGKTPWKINGRLFDVMVKVWNTGDALTNFPPVNMQVEFPPEPPKTADALTMRKWRLKTRELKNMLQGHQSNRCYLNLQLEVARAFKPYEFYVPHNMDFRGRAYPVAGIFNHMGADHARALCIFAEGKELGEVGLSWLKIHLTNTFGNDKISLEEREQFAMDQIDNIRDSVEKPLDGRRWWMSAEDPWQCLATCMELVAALDSPDPTKFISHLPIHQDGTCNGLQHYAALGGDTLGAAQVNLVPSRRPADIYTQVAQLVAAELERDVALGIPEAKLLQGKITRKIVKQPVMTNVYGVTHYGAKLQIQKRLDDIFPLSNTGVHNGDLAWYITNKIFKVFGDMFSGATKIQDWLGECAGTISTSLSPEQIDDVRVFFRKSKAQANAELKVSFQSSVIWTTPLNLPVVQPYREVKSTPVHTALQTYVSLKAPTANYTVKKRKQKAAFPPNFIHSLDATHMMLSALKCSEQSLTFAAVHDSFWTHAADVPALGVILRDAFVQMHSEDIIGRLSEELSVRYSKSMQIVTVPASSHLAKEIFKLRRTLRAKFRKTPGSEKLKSKISDSAIINQDSYLIWELVMEHDRLQLLRSKDAEERQKGADTVTPGSLYAAALEHPERLLPTKKPCITDYELETEPDHTDESTIEGVADIEATASKEDSKTKKSTKKSTPSTVKFWVPVTFPPVPKRGAFDVSILRASEYFFS
jgi:DNA-directed RNA polymerase